MDLNNLGELYRLKGNYPSAETLYRRAMTIRHSGVGDADPQLAIVLGNLAALYVAQEQYAEAEPLYEQVVDHSADGTRARSSRSCRQPDRSRRASMRCAERPAQAEARYRRALEVRERALGPSGSARRDQPAYARVFLRGPGKARRGGAAVSACASDPRARRRGEQPDAGRDARRTTRPCSAPPGGRTRRARWRPGSPPSDGDTASPSTAPGASR